MSSEPSSANPGPRSLGLPTLLRGLVTGDAAGNLLALLDAPPPRTIVAIAIGAACAIVSLVLRFVATPYIGDGEALLTAFPLVLVATLTTGRWAGWTCLVLCTIGSWYLFIGDAFSFSFGTNEAGILVGTFLAGAFVIQICVLMRRMFHEIAALRETERLLSRELEHRIKNTLTLVVGIARQTFRAERPVVLALDDFEGRMIALAGAQDLLGRGEQKPASIARIAEQSLSPFCGPALGRRLALCGPDLTVDAATTVALFLIFHELATNSAKYGALSAAAGTVEIAWARDAGTGRRLEMSWRDRDGPPVNRPDREGFGTQLLNRIVTRTLRGAITLDYEPAGFSARLVLPV